MRPRDDAGHFLSWDDALTFRYDYEAVAAAADGETWAAWLLTLLEAEEAGADVEAFDSWREFEDVILRDMAEEAIFDMDDDSGRSFYSGDEWLDPWDEIEVTADLTYEER